jgi:hypothetical protein
VLLYRKGSALADGLTPCRDFAALLAAVRPILWRGTALAARVSPIARGYAEAALAHLRELALARISGVWHMLAKAHTLAGDPARRPLPPAGHPAAASGGAPKLLM